MAIAHIPPTVATPRRIANHVWGAAMPMNRLTNGEAGTVHLPLLDRYCAELMNVLPKAWSARNAITASPTAAIVTEISMPRKIVLPG